MADTKNTKYLFFALISLAFLTNFGISIISPLMGVIRSDLKTTVLWMALIFGLFPAFRGIFSPVCAKFIDKYSIKKMLLCSIIIYTVFSFLYIFGSTVLFLSFIRIIQGIAAAFAFTITVTYTGLIPKEKEGMGKGFTVIGATIFGLAFGPLVGGVIYDEFGYYLVFIIMGIIEGSGIFIILYFIPEYDKSSKSNKEIIPSKKNIMQLGKYHLSWIIILFQFTTFCQITIILSYLAIYVRDKRVPISISEIGMILFIMVLILGIMISPIGYYSEKLMNDKFQHLYLLIIGTVLTTVSMFMLPFSRSLFMVLMAVVVNGVGIGLVNPAAISCVYYMGRHHGTALWWSMLSMINAFAYFAAPLIAGLIYTFIDMDWVFYIFGIMGIITVIIGIYHISRILRGYHTRPRLKDFFNKPF